MCAAPRQQSDASRRLHIWASMERGGLGGGHWTGKFDVGGGIAAVADAVVSHSKQ